MSEAEIQRQKEIQQAEELLFGGPEVLGFAKGLFLGRFVSDWVMPYSQMANCKVLEEIGKRCASTSVFVNAHHSIGIRALLLFGTKQQQQQWLPKLVTGEWLGAFALTEESAGSDAANVQMRATPSED